MRASTLSASLVAGLLTLACSACLPSGQSRDTYNEITADAGGAIYRAVSVPTAQAFARYCRSYQYRQGVWPKTERFQHSTSAGNVQASFFWSRYQKSYWAFRVENIAHEEIAQFLNPSGDDLLHVCHLNTGPIPNGHKAVADALGFQIVRRGPGDDGTIKAGEGRSSWTAISGPEERMMLLMTQQYTGNNEFDALLVVAHPKGGSTMTIGQRLDAERRRHPGWTPPPRFMEAILAAYEGKLPAVMAKWEAEHARRNAESAARAAEIRRQWAAEDARKPNAFEMALGIVAVDLQQTADGLRQRQEILDDARYRVITGQGEPDRRRGNGRPGSGLALKDCPTRRIDPPVAYADRITPLTYNSCDDGAEAATRARMNEWVASLRRQDAAAARPRPMTRVEEKPQPKLCQNLRPGEICTTDK